MKEKIKKAGIGAKATIENYDGMVFAGEIKHIDEDSVTIFESSLGWNTTIEYLDIKELDIEEERDLGAETRAAMEEAEAEARIGSNWCSRKDRACEFALNHRIEGFHCTAPNDEAMTCIK